MKNINAGNNVMELWEVLDDNGNPTGEIMKKYDQKVFDRGFYHLGADVWIINSDNKILIQKRANEKAVQPHENRRTLTELKNFMMTDIMEAQKKQSSILVVNSSASIEDIQSQIMQKIIERLISRKNKSNNNHSTIEEKEI